jgi:hypothetical protein
MSNDLFSPRGLEIAEPRARNGEVTKFEVKAHANARRSRR